MRHAIAEDREDWAKKSDRPDDERPLTKEGLARLQDISGKLAGLDIRIGTIVQSPLTRSRQTAEVVAKHFKNAHITTIASLRPDGDFMDLINGLNEIDDKDDVMIIGHEDHLSRFAMFLLTGEDGLDFMKFKKAGLGSFLFEGKLVPRDVQLEWLLTPKLILAL
jgi:phosphohistidine phosphatase